MNVSGSKARRVQARSQSRARGRRQPRPLPPGRTLLTPGASAARATVEERSATTLLWLHQLPGWLPPVLIAGLAVAGLAVRGIAGAVALCGVAALLGWLAALSWPRLTAGGRLLRAGAVLAVVISAVTVAFR